MIEGNQKEYMDELILHINTDAKEVIGRLNKKWNDKEIRWDIIIQSLGTMYYFESLLYSYCQEHNPPKEISEYKENKEGNVKMWGPYRENLSEYLKEYDFTNVDPEGYKECSEYWKFPTAKKKMEMIEAFQHICEGKKPPIKKYYLG